MKKTKYFVLDTNLLVSTFLLAPSSVTAQAYYKARKEGQIVMSKDTYEEFANVFVRPKFDKYISLDKRVAIIDDLKKVVKIVPVSISIKACRDSKDDNYLELDITAKSNCIITGDNDLLVLNPFRNITILTTGEFLLKNELS